MEILYIPKQVILQITWRLYIEHEEIIMNMQIIR